MQSQPLRRGLQNRELPIRRQRGHGQGPLPWTVQRRAGVVARDANLVFRLVVRRLQIVIGDRPILERRPGRHAVRGAHPKILRQEAPGHGTVRERPASNACCVVLIAAIAGQNGRRFSAGAHPHPRIALFLRTKRIAQHRRSLVAEIVLAAVIRGVPPAALQKSHAESGSRQFLCDDTAGCAGAHHNSVDALHGFSGKLYRARPRTGGWVRPSMRQLTASRLPPCRGEP